MCDEAFVTLLSFNVCRVGGKESSLEEAGSIMQLALW